MIEVKDVRRGTGTDSVMVKRGGGVKRSRRRNQVVRIGKRERWKKA